MKPAPMQHFAVLVWAGRLALFEWSYSRSGALQRKFRKLL